VLEAVTAALGADEPRVRRSLAALHPSLDSVADAAL
jgi:hypothetical protein